MQPTIEVATIGEWTTSIPEYGMVVSNGSKNEKVTVPISAVAGLVAQSRIVAPKGFDADEATAEAELAAAGQGAPA